MASLVKLITCKSLFLTGRLGAVVVQDLGVCTVGALNRLNEMLKCQRSVGLENIFNVAGCDYCGWGQREWCPPMSPLEIC
uniref:Uncharacterized protein n=1 Tax=Rhizophora mucronata TaxID=61149 RepID=A0A2P2KLT3_RHIMU